MNEIFENPEDFDTLQISNPKLEAALRYAAQGYPVLPLNGKKPVVCNGYLDATTDQSVIANWWGYGREDWNIGIPTGSISGFWVLDIDQKPNGANGVFSLVQHTTQHGALPLTVTQNSGSGTHLFFKLGETGVGCSAERVGSGIDVRGNGGYIVVAPSVHPETGRTYQWLPDQSLLDMEPPEAPLWLVELTRKQKAIDDLYEPLSPPNSVHHPKKYGNAALDRECQRIESAPNGQQEVTLNSSSFAIGKLIAAGCLSEIIAIERLNEAAGKMPSHDRKRPWTNPQIFQKISRAIAQGKKSKINSH